MKLNFFKMQAQGNDYLFFDFLHENVPQIDFPKLAQKICDRHFGVGADGIVLLLKSSENDAIMKIYNADGSQAEMCGSALRCTVAYLNSLSEKRTFSIQTKAGQRIGWLVSNEGSPVVKADFGLPKLLNKDLLKIGNFEGLAVSIGNPHFVTFVDNLDADIAEKFGPEIEINELFPERTNIEFVKIISLNKIEIKVWERGTGETLACGTGACAAVFAGIHQKLLENSVDVIFPGGTLKVEFNGESIFLTGKVDFVFSGVYEF